MRVVRSSVYRRYTSSLNDLQSNLNKSMNKVSTGAAYETAADNPWISTFICRKKRGHFCMKSCKNVRVSVNFQQCAGTFACQLKSLG